MKIISFFLGCVSPRKKSNSLPSTPLKEMQTLLFYRL